MAVAVAVGETGEEEGGGVSFHMTSQNMHLIMGSHVPVDMAPDPTLDSRHQMARIPSGSAAHLHVEI